MENVRVGAVRHHVQPIRRHTAAHEARGDFFDAAATVKAGISLAGIASVGFQGGGGYNIAARFSNPSEAGSWLYAQLGGINERSGGELLGARSDATTEVNPLVVEEKRIMGGVYGEAGLGGANIEGEGTVTSSKADFSKNGKQVMDEDGQELKRSEVRKQATIGASFRASSGWGLDASYTYTGTHISGDANSANDGDYRNHNVDIGLSFGKLLEFWQR